ncbi:MFS transporter [Spelaeicoccus albus]|uniref:UMF1 family MFS transporter n=1 Tax=Spelaeicoccus albus TaxID=1280376 RepID=A0A7Z0D115_9MICO|nr:MFS transporter [Spelaeicoccus albus]NYI66173.1 UMF1 family MFS transporter [Spelaeicoccus albus]
MSSITPPTDARAGDDASPVRRRAVMSWALWDWGSAAFNAVIVTFVFAPYLTKGVAENATTGSQYLGYALSIAGAIIAIVAPAAGTRADERGRHKFWLGLHTAIVIACMAGMFFVRDSPSYLLLGLVLLSVGSVFFEFAGVSYNSLLVRVSSRTNVGKISGFGWGMGYVGGLVLLALMLVAFILPGTGLFGVGDAGGLRYRAVALAAACWFFVFAIPVMLFVPTLPARPGDVEAKPRGPLGSIIAFFADYKRVVLRIARLWRHDRRTLHFFVASAIFRDGLAAIFSFAGVLAAGSYGFGSSTIIVLGIAANVVAGVGAWIAGPLDDRLGPKLVIVVSLCCLVLGIIPIVASGSSAVFWVMALFLSFFVGPVQASSRSLLARLTAPGHEGENFGLYATTGRAVSFMGPLAFSTAIGIFGFQRAGAVGVGVVLLIGLVIVWPLKVTRTA